MNWYVVRLPVTGGVGVVAESALDIHRDRGWIRCSGPIAESSKDHLRLGDYTVDLDAEPESAASDAVDNEEEQQ